MKKASNRHPAWRDASSYSQGERGKTEPTVWEIETSGLRVTVHRLHGITEPIWFGTCHAMGVERIQLGEDLEACKRQFLSYLKKRAWNWADKLAELEVP